MPAVGKPPGDPVPAGTSTASPNGPVLLIDEDPQMGELVREALAGGPREVLVSSRVEEGLRQAARSKPALVLIEGRFTGFARGDGVELAGKLVAAPATSSSAVAVVTAEKSLSRRFRAMQLGVADYIVKPIAAEALAKRLEGLLTRLQKGRPSPARGAAVGWVAGEVGRLVERGEGRLELSRGGEPALIELAGGRLSTVRWGAHAGLLAFDAIARVGDWDVPQEELAPLPLGGEPDDDGVIFSDDESTVMDRPPDLQSLPSTLDYVAGGDADLPTLDDDDEEADTDPRLQSASRQRRVTGPSRSSAPPASQEGAEQSAPLEPLLEHFGRGLLVVTGHAGFRDGVIEGARRHGFEPFAAETAVQAYQQARAQRPVAIIADAKLADAPGRDLLAAVRCDYLIRETAFVIAPGEQLAGGGGTAALARLFDGMAKALAPRAHLWQRLGNNAAAEGGWLEPVGVMNLLRMAAVDGHTGVVQLRYQDRRNAEVLMHQGQICGVTVNAPQASVGPLAMLHLLTYEWSNFHLISEASTSQVPLGEVSALIENAGYQNNLLLERIYREGVKIEGVAVDRNHLEAYLGHLPASALARMMRLIDGEAPAVLASQGVATPGALKALIHDLRRKAVIRAESLKPVRSARPTGTAEVSAVVAAAPPPGRSRWLIVVLTTAVTMVLAVAGFLIHHQLADRKEAKAPPAVVVPPVKAPPAKAGPTKAGPTKAGPTKAGPTKAGPTKAGPVKTAPTEAGPAKAGPAKAAPTKAAPTKAGAANAAPAKAGPTKAGPTKAGPAKAAPAKAAPAKAGPTAQPLEASDGATDGGTKAAPANGA